MHEQVRNPDEPPTRPGEPPVRSPADGVALLITVLILFVVSLLGATMVNLGSVDLTLSANYRANTASVHLADSGLEATAADLMADYNNDPANSALAGWVDLNSRPPRLINPFPNAAGMAVNGHTLSRAVLIPNPFPGVPYNVGTPVALGNGSYSRTVWLPPTINVQGGRTTLDFRVRAEGREHHRETPAATVVDAVVSVDVIDLSGYKSAMFLGAGRNGSVVSGGFMRVAGPMVVVGDPAAPGRGGGRGRRSGSELRLTSFSRIMNGYQGISRPDGIGPLASKLPRLNTQQHNGESVTALDTTLHLKDVDLVVQPAASVGAPDAPGNGYKETLDGIYTDDYVGPNNRNIHVDDVGPFDLGNIEFPSLAKPFTDPASGALYSTYSAWLDANAFAPLGGSDLEITPRTASFSLVDPWGRGSLSWDAAAETLTVDGLIKIDGRVVLGQHGNAGGGGTPSLSAVRYAGTGVLWSTGNIEINQDLYPDGRYLRDGPDADSLVDGNLGLISSADIRLDAGSPNGNLRVVAALFAEDRVDVRSSANVAGSLIARHVNLRGFRRLSTWYVPALAAGAPPGMPGTVSAPTVRVGVGEWFQRR